MNLRRVRACWWQSMESICLVNQWWDGSKQEVIASPEKRQSTKVIQAAYFDVQRYRTILQLKGASSPVEIEL